MTKKSYITVLNVLASLAVVFLHTNKCFHRFSVERYWATANIIESVFYFAVPVFFMISGATLIDYRERYDTKTFFKKRFIKTLIPYICFVIIGIIYGVITGKIVINQNIVIYLVNSLFAPKYPNIYWFFLPLFTAYLCIPVISRIEKQYRKEVFEYIIILFMILNVALPFICNLSGQFQYNTALSMALGTNYIFYLFLGYYIANYEIPKKIRYLIYILGVAGLITQIIGTYFASIKIDAVSSLFKGYTGLPCVLSSAAVFLYFKNIDFEKIPFVVKICDFFKGETFGVYLVHIYVIDICMIIGISDLSIIFRTVGAVIIFVVSALIVKILKKIPIVKKLVP